MVYISVKQAIKMALQSTKEYIDNAIDENIPCYCKDENLIYTVSITDIQTKLNGGSDIVLTNLDPTYSENKRYYVEFIGKKELGSVYTTQEDTHLNISCNFKTCLIDIYYSTSSNVMKLDIVKQSTDVAITATELKIYEVEVECLDNKYLPVDLITQRSISMGRTGKIGTYSTAIGFNTEASGVYSHAEGSHNKASGQDSHAEGYKTQSTSYATHAEGYITEASGYASHSEGNNTKASGLYSHAEGLGTIANGTSQHVQGEYNIIDTEESYVHIVGNGYSNTARSNAYTLDWSGNAWYAGKLSQEGTPTENKDLTTKKYVDDLVANGHTHDEYASKNSPVFANSISLGRKEGTTVGADSIALGMLVEASGQLSFAIGAQTVASGAGAYAEGSATQATAMCAHAEGNYSKATEAYAHAEGYRAIASGQGSHAEGYNVIASGQGAHAEGSSTQAITTGSHAEGFGTIANGLYQHVQGKYNIEDEDGVYAHIVGNGEKYFDINNPANSREDRSNAHTLDWEGNAWYAGKLTQEGIPTEDKDVTTKKYVDDLVANNSGGTADSIDWDDIQNKPSAFSPDKHSHDEYAPKNSPVFTGTLSMSRVSGAAVGQYSIALGSNVTASGKKSIALGDGVTASGASSFACGAMGTASGSVSYAEGFFCTAGNDSAHAEGCLTQALGKQSHSEGISTIAKGEGQHVQGKFNIQDTEDKYAHIVGNGTDDQARSNAHTLDWNGNGWYSGKLSQEGTPTEDKDVATKKYVDDLVADNGDINLSIYGADLSLNDNTLKLKNSDGEEIGTGVTLPSSGDGFNTISSTPILTLDSTTIKNNWNSDYADFEIPDLPLLNLSYDKRYIVEFLGKKQLCSLDKDAYLLCNFGTVFVSIEKYQSSATEYNTVVIIQAPPNEEGNSTDISNMDLTDLVLYEEEVTIIDSKYLDSDLKFINSIGLGRVGTVGSNSCAIGYAVEASGDYSHAEGFYNIAKGTGSHAEGRGTKASGNNSHAEGYAVEASGSDSHAEGRGTKASGNNSHAEGYDTKANGFCSHAEGGVTIANGDYQHVEGRYNIEDTKNKYAHIVGNGAVPSGSNNWKATKSNAHTLDWNGNGWYAGKLTQEGTPTEDKDLATKKYVDDLVAVEHTHDEYAPKNSPDFTGDISMYRKSGTTVGQYSVALGSNVTASGKKSTAFGDGSIASGSASFVCGAMSTASGSVSHAEGFYCTAGGASSHAEGTLTQALGEQAHSEGNNTIAKGDYQHVQGKWNIQDNENKYAHIVGNGTDNNARVNIHTLDWSGNGWFKGDVYVGGTSQDNGKKLLSTADIYFDTDGNLCVTIGGVTKKFAPIEQ